MFSAITTYLGTGITAFFSLIGTTMSGFVALIYDTTLTDLGELILIGGIVGLGWFGIKFVLKLIPFAKS